MKLLKVNLRKFLNSAVIDPNDRKDSILYQIVEEGTPQQFEMKAMECIQEAHRIGLRLEERSNDETLLEFYVEKMRLAATYISLAAEKTNGRIRLQGENTTGSKDPKGTGRIPKNP
jgi:hypothetical protein